MKNEVWCLGVGASMCHRCGVVASAVGRRRFSVEAVSGGEGRRRHSVEGHWCLSVGASARRALVEERLVEERILERRVVEARGAGNSWER